MTRRLNGKLQDVLLQVVERLIDQLSHANEACCYLTLDLNSVPPPNPGQFIYAVKPGPGSFDEANWDGGGQDMATTLSDITVRIFSPQYLDEHGRDTSLLTNDSLGILEEWRKMVKCLTVEDWTPEVEVEGETIQIFRDPLIPTGWDFGELPLQNGATIGWAQQSFRVSFDLDLS